MIRHLAASIEKTLLSASVRTVKYQMYTRDLLKTGQPGGKGSTFASCKEAQL